MFQRTSVVMWPYFFRAIPTFRRPRAPTSRGRPMVERRMVVWRVNWSVVEEV